MSFVTPFWLKNLVGIKKDVLHLVYPERCLICDLELAKSEHHCCASCTDSFHFTDFELYQDKTTLDQLFWGRKQVYFTYALLYFTENSATRKLLHAIKYKGKPDLAEYLGKLTGERIKNIPDYREIEALIPVPLHYRKQYLRGYNQSEALAKGIAKYSEMSLESKLLTRKQYAESQTKMGRFKRWDNIKEAFVVDEKIKSYQHIALVDDVVTTGSTLEACITALHEVNPKLKISIISLAIAQ